MYGGFVPFNRRVPSFSQTHRHTQTHSHTHTHTHIHTHTHTHTHTQTHKYSTHNTPLSFSVDPFLTMILHICTHTHSHVYSPYNSHTHSQAIYQLYQDPNPASKTQADQWLQTLQVSPPAWNIAWVLLQHQVRTMYAILFNPPQQMAFRRLTM